MSTAFMYKHKSFSDCFPKQNVITYKRKTKSRQCSHVIDCS